MSGLALAADPTPAESPEAAPTAWVVSGQVLDGEGGGIEDVVIEVEQGGTAETAGAVVGRARTDALGDYHVALTARPDGPLFVRANKPGFATAHLAAQFDEGETEAFVTIDLQGALAVRGHVTSMANGKPIAAANVHVSIGAFAREGLADASGTFEVQGVPQGRGAATVWRDGFVRWRGPVEVGATGGELSVRLAPERPVCVRVTNAAGEPVAAATIEAMAGRERLTATTDDAGYADLHGVSPDAKSLSLRVNHADYAREQEFGHELTLAPFARTTQPTATAPASRPATPAPPATRPGAHVVTLQRGAVLTGRVVDAQSGEPIHGARLLVGETYSYTMPMAWTNADGEFRLDRLPPGAMTLTVQQADFAPDLLEISVAAGETRTLDVRLGAGERVAGEVVDLGGHGIADVQVVCTAWRRRDTVGLRTLTDAEGRFTIEHAPPGPMEFYFLTPNGRILPRRTLVAGKTNYRFTMGVTEPEPAAAGNAGLRQAGALKVGDPAPEIVVTTLDGATHRLSQMRGKYVLIDVWATWCPPCVREMPRIRQLYAIVRYREDFVLLGVSLDEDAAPVRDFAKQNGIEWPLAAGSESGAELAAGTLGTDHVPFNCLVGPDGRVLAIEVHGDDMAKEIQNLAPPVKGP